MLYIPGWISHLDLYWEEPGVARFLRRLGAGVRLILFDRRGDRALGSRAEDNLPTLEGQVDDARAVLDAAGSERAAIFAQGFGVTSSSWVASPRHVKSTCVRAARHALLDGSGIRDSGRTCSSRNERSLQVIVLGVICLILGLVLSVGILWTIGLILIAVGIILAILGTMDRAIGPRRHYW